MRVLLVEDDDGVANALVEVLGAHGHVPTHVRRGADALTNHRDNDLVLLDLGLPDIDGLDVLRKLRRVATVPVVVLTAHGQERTVVRGLRSGATTWSNRCGWPSCSPGSMRSPAAAATPHPRRARRCGSGMWKWRWGRGEFVPVNTTWS